MILQFIIWIIVTYIAAKIIGQLIRAVRLFMTPNRDVKKTNTQPPFREKKNIEDIPYEEIKEK